MFWKCYRTENKISLKISHSIKSTFTYFSKSPSLHAFCVITVCYVYHIMSERTNTETVKNSLRLLNQARSHVTIFLSNICVSSVFFTHPLTLKENKAITDQSPKTDFFKFILPCSYLKEKAFCSRNFSRDLENRLLCPVSNADPVFIHRYFIWSPVAIVINMI